MIPMISKSKHQAKKPLDRHKQQKDEEFDFDRIRLLFKNNKPEGFLQVISDRTWSDLDMDEVFMFADRTCSKIGQQYLYLILRTIPGTNERIQQFERIISFLNSKEEVKEKVIVELNRLTEHGAYFIQKLIYGKNLQKPSWYWCLPFLSGLAIGSFVSMLFFPVYPLFILIVAINFIIHFWNKNNLLTYSNSVPQMIHLVKTSQNLLQIPELYNDHHVIEKSWERVAKTTRKSRLLTFESRVSSELGQVAEYFLELIKGAFLIEPLIMFKLIKELEEQKGDIEKLLLSTATIDVAIAISSLREELPVYCKHSPGGSLKINKVYHPLIQNPVANSFDLPREKSALISGSNMSGKTTFIRTIGINAILVQTINTACALEFSVPKIKIHSAIRIADDLFNETSYYFEEVKVIKEMIDECQAEGHNLFILDELFKGTNTIERVASGKAVLSYLNQKENIVIASTHDLELTDYLADSFLFFHFEEIVDKEELAFDFKLKSGKWTNTNAIRILEMKGYPKEITNEARELAFDFRKRRKAK